MISVEQINTNSFIVTGLDIGGMQYLLEELIPLIQEHNGEE